MSLLESYRNELLIQKYNNHSVFQVCLQSRTNEPLSLEADEKYLNRQIEKAICSAWCARHTEHREPFINGKAIAVEQCHYRTDDRGWTCSFTLRIEEPFHGLYIHKCLEHAGAYRGIGKGAPHSNYAKFDLQSMEPVDAKGNA